MDRPILAPFRKLKNPFKTWRQARGDSASTAATRRNAPEEMSMPQYVIERELAGAGKLTPAELQAISATSCGVLRDLGPSVQWVHSYVTDDKIYCVYNAASEALVREHARLGGFPANSVAQVRTVISPITAEA
jgi:hypothetical protein